jgi:hypothetical protein
MEDVFIELDIERKKIAKKKKNKKERNKDYRMNTRQVAYNICRALNKTVLHYKAIYHENDYYRHKKLYDVQAELDSDPPSKNVSASNSRQTSAKVSIDKDGQKIESPEMKMKKEEALLEQLKNFFQSPFRKDREFVIQYMA